MALLLSVIFSFLVWTNLGVIRYVLTIFYFFSTIYKNISSLDINKACSLTEKAKHLCDPSDTQCHLLVQQLL